MKAYHADPTIYKTTLRKFIIVQKCLLKCILRTITRPGLFRGSLPICDLVVNLFAHYLLIQGRIPTDLKKAKDFYVRHTCVIVKKCILGTLTILWLVCLPKT